MTTVSPPNPAAPLYRAAVDLVRTGIGSIGWLGAVVVSSVPGVAAPALGALLVSGTVLAVTGYSDPGAMFAFVLALATAVLMASPAVRLNAGWTRSQIERRCGVRVPVSYTERPELEVDERGYWWTGYSYHRGQGVARAAQLVHWSLRDPATRAEMVWLLVNPVAVLVLLGPVVGFGLGGVILTFSGFMTYQTYGPVSGAGAALISAVLGGTMVLLTLGLLPHALRAHADMARRILDPNGRASNIQLTRRVVELTETRADAVGSQAAELRRIERDLHDGAQARLVSIGLTLGTIEHLLESDPDAAKQLLAETRESSAKALQELRDLVKGIHPPVLAERGLGDAVRALALDSTQDVEVTVGLPSRPELPMEAAVYFSISELLVNAAKHSGAQHVWVDILHRAGRLRVTVTDDGRGGATKTPRGGLRGIERRLGTFDGVLSVSSPLGGPTTITMELPCALSSPRTSTSSEKG